MFNLERGLGHMSTSELTLKYKDEPVHRFEVFTGNGRRREWSDDQKARIIAESCEPWRDGVLCGAAAWVDAAAIVHMATAHRKAS
ncbi:hypothetical protein ACVIRO_006294 [Rhizobium ruizarguesonis]